MESLLKKFGEPDLETKLIPQQKKMAVTNLLPNQAAACVERRRCKTVSKLKEKKNQHTFNQGENTESCRVALSFKKVACWSLYISRQ